MSAKEYFQRDAERETFYRTFYQICRRFNVTWSTATPEVRAFIEEVTRVTYEQEKAKRNGVSLSTVKIQPRKNIETIVNAFLCLAKEELTSQLVLAGGTGWGMDKVLEKIQKSESKDRIVLTGYVSEEEKAGLYKNAEAFLFPSLYEGFGIPILESFSYGIPVITAKNSSLPEVGGDAAIYIENVMSSEELEERMKMVLGLSEADRISLSEKGVRQFNRFTWKKCAREISKLFCGKTV